MIDCSFLQVLNEKGYIVADFRGTSMLPLLKVGRDRVLLKKPIGRLKKGDVALFSRESGAYILHRVYKVYTNSYAFVGDNHFTLEYGVKDENILGIMVGYYKGDKFIDVEKSIKYKLYKLFWCNSLNFRRFLNIFRRVNHKIKKLFKNNK